VCEAIVRAMVAEGMSATEARACFCVVDNRGVLGPGRKEESLSPAQRVFADANSLVPDGTSLLDAVKIAKPSILLGLSGVGGLFTEDIIRTMTEHTERPSIFPLSNPSRMSECTAKEAFEWSAGRVLFASGSPFDDVDLGNGGMLRAVFQSPAYTLFANAGARGNHSSLPC
jgi:malic enzyme